MAYTVSGHVALLQQLRQGSCSENTVAGWLHRGFSGELSDGA